MKTGKSIRNHKLEASLENIWQGFNFQSKLSLPPEHDSLTPVEKHCLIRLGDFAFHKKCWKPIDSFRKRFRYKLTNTYSFINERRDLAGRGIYTGFGDIRINKEVNLTELMEVPDVRSHLAMGVDMNQTLIPDWKKPDEKEFYRAFFVFRIQQLDSATRVKFLEYTLATTFNRNLKQQEQFLQDILIDHADLLGNSKVTINRWLAGHPTINEALANKMRSLAHYEGVMKLLVKMEQFDTEGKYIYAGKDRIVNAIELLDALIRKGYFRKGSEISQREKTLILKQAFGITLGQNTSSIHRKHNKQFERFADLPQA